MNDEDDNFLTYDFAYHNFRLRKSNLNFIIFQQFAILSQEFR